VHAPRRRPVALREKVLEELQRMEQMGVIAKQTEPTEWVDSIEPVVTSKKTHICVDPKDLNLAIKREHYPMLTAEDGLKNAECKVLFCARRESRVWADKAG